MKNQIKTIEDIQAERARLKNKIENTRLVMKKELNAIKAEINPARQAVGMLSNALTSPKKGLLNVGIGFGVDILLRRTLLARAGWATKLIVPFLVKNVAKNYISQNKTTVVEKGLRWLKKVTDKPTI